jgi:serine/threonine protein kinase
MGASPGESPRRHVAARSPRDTLRATRPKTFTLHVETRGNLARDTMGDLVGQSLAHFRIVDRLGEGGMGVVYKATDEKLRRTVALKVLPEALAKDEERRRRLVREARAAAAVTHPNIAAVYDVGESEGRIFIAMEFVEGQTLRERLGDGALPVPLT